MKERSQPALLVANKDRIKRPDQTKPEDFKKPLHEQPIIYTPVKYGTAPLVTTAIRFLVRLVLLLLVQWGQLLAVQLELVLVGWSTL